MGGPPGDSAAESSRDSPRAARDQCESVDGGGAWLLQGPSASTLISQRSAGDKRRGFQRGMVARAGGPQRVSRAGRCFRSHPLTRRAIWPAGGRNAQRSGASASAVDAGRYASSGEGKAAMKRSIKRCDILGQLHWFWLTSQAAWLNFDSRKTCAPGLAKNKLSGAARI